MRDRDEVAKLALRAVKTALTEARKAGADHEQNEEQIIAIIQREAKRRREAAAEYERVGATLQAQQELAELAVLERYLPRQMDESEIEALARKVIADLGVTSPREMGRVMSTIMGQVSGLADGKVVNQIVRRLLGS